MKLIAFIGTRDLDIVTDEQIGLYQEAAESAVKCGYTLVTGAAPGADQLAADTALMAGGHVMLKLPWSSYQEPWVSSVERCYPGKVRIEVYKPQHHGSWTASVYQYHPAAESLSQGTFALHARNYGIIEHTRTVVALPNPEKVGGGGTGQGIRIAAALRIRCFNLSNPLHVQDLETRLNARQLTMAV